MEAIKKLTDESPMPYGKHRGTKMGNVPADYLIWLFDNNKTTGQLTVYIHENMDSLEKETRRNKQ